MTENNNHIGKRLLNTRVLKDKKPVYIYKVTNISRGRISEFKSGIQDFSKKGFNVHFIENLVNNTDITPEELYEIFAGRLFKSDKKNLESELQQAKSEIEILKREREELLKLSMKLADKIPNKENIALTV